MSGCLPQPVGWQAAMTHFEVCGDNCAMIGGYFSASWRIRIRLRFFGLLIFFCLGFEEVGDRVCYAVELVCGEVGTGGEA